MTMLNRLAFMLIRIFIFFAICFSCTDFSEIEYKQFSDQTTSPLKKNIIDRNIADVFSSQENTSYFLTEDRLPSDSCIFIKNHPYYKDTVLDERHQKNFLTNFDPTKLYKPPMNTPESLSTLFKPIANDIPFNADQIRHGNDYSMPNDFYGALNMNADLGLQYTLGHILRGKVITYNDEKGFEVPTFIILSSGHSIAGLEELSKMTRLDSSGKTQCLFDTSVYFPMGSWSFKANRLSVATQGATIWGGEIYRNKKFCKENTMAGGIAIALNGHRGDRDLTNKNATFSNIDPNEMLGSVDDFVKMLAKRGLRRVVIITETHVENTEIPNMFPLEKLKKDDPSFNPSNKDLYEYFVSVKSKGVDVLVASGEQRVNKCKVRIGEF
ncbi:MAG: hypothetical protein ACXVCN_07190 [Bdellovibrio sp.]